MFLTEVVLSAESFPSASPQPAASCKRSSDTCLEMLLTDYITGSCSLPVSVISTTDTSHDKDICMAHHAPPWIQLIVLLVHQHWKQQCICRHQLLVTKHVCRGSRLHTYTSVISLQDQSYQSTVAQTMANETSLQDTHTCSAVP